MDAAGELAAALAEEKRKNVSLQDELRRTRAAAQYAAQQAEEEEENITLRLQKRIAQLSGEQQLLSRSFEAEEEAITNALQKKIKQVEADKVSLERALEAEQEYLVNRLTSQLAVQGRQKAVLQIQLEEESKALGSAQTALASLRNSGHGQRSSCEERDREHALSHALGTLENEMEAESEAASIRLMRQVSSARSRATEVNAAWALALRDWLDEKRHADKPLNPALDGLNEFISRVEEAQFIAASAPLPVPVSPANHGSARRSHRASGAGPDSPGAERIGQPSPAASVSSNGTAFRAGRVGRLDFTSLGQGQEVRRPVAASPFSPSPTRCGPSIEHLTDTKGDVDYLAERLRKVHAECNVLRNENFCLQQRLLEMRADVVESTGDRTRLAVEAEADSERLVHALAALGRSRSASHSTLPGDTTQVLGSIGTLGPAQLSLAGSVTGSSVHGRGRAASDRSPSWSSLSLSRGASVSSMAGRSASSVGPGPVRGEE